MMHLRSMAACLGAVALLFGACSSDDDDDSSSSSDGETATTAEAGSDDSSGGQDATPAIVAAANAFLDTLSDDQKASVQFSFDDTEALASDANPIGGVPWTAGSVQVRL